MYSLSPMEKTFIYIENRIFHFLVATCRAVFLNLKELIIRKPASNHVSETRRDIRILNYLKEFYQLPIIICKNHLIKTIKYPMLSLAPIFAPQSSKTSMMFVFPLSNWQIFIHIANEILYFLAATCKGTHLNLKRNNTQILITSIFTRQDKNTRTHW